MSEWPNGTITFLLTDIEDSTRHAEREPERMGHAVNRHDRLGEDCVMAAGGKLVKKRGEGDSLFIVFARASDAVAAACALQHALHREEWQTAEPLRVRMALHTGEAELQDEDYRGAVINRCARIRAAAHGGQILLTQTTLNLLGGRLPEGISLRPLGTHRLRDLQQPETLYQLSHPDWHDETRSLRSLEAFHHNLPLQLTSFIGREQEMLDIKALLQSSRLITLLGSGGCGKTRLALQVAADIVDHYAEGVWLVELASLPSHSDAFAVQKAVSDALGVREEAGRPLLATLIDYLKTRSQLLLLDNCEHLEKACARTVTDLLRACPNLRILATSRSRLGVGGERAWQVPSLAAPEADSLLTPREALCYASIRLFEERAADIVPHYAITTKKLPAITQICRRLDGIPFEIELSAALLTHLSTEQVAEGLHDRLSLLTQGDSTANERHHTLRALLDWSYLLLTETERTLLSRLSVFAGSWTYKATMDVCSDERIDPGQIQGLLRRLVDSSLVRAEPHKEEIRYRLLESVRQYSRESLDRSGESDQIHQQHVCHYLNLVEQAEPNLTGAEQQEWLERLDAERDNIRAALSWTVETDIRLRMASALWRYWSNRGYFTEGRGWLEGAVLRGGSAPAALRAKALNALGVLATAQGDHEPGLTALEESLALRQSANDRHGIAETLNNLGNIARAQNDSARAKECYEQSLELREAIGDRWGTAAACNNLGMVFYAQEDYEEARRYYTRSLELYRKLKDTAQIAVALSNLGLLASDEKDYAEASRLFEESLVQLRAVGNIRGVAICLHNLGEVVFRLEGPSAARPYIVESLRLRYEMGDKRGVCFPLLRLAHILYAEEQYERNLQLLSFSEVLSESHGIIQNIETREESDNAFAFLKVHFAPEEYDRLWKLGKGMPLAEAVVCALE